MKLADEGLGVGICVAFEIGSTVEDEGLEIGAQTFLNSLEQVSTEGYRCYSSSHRQFF